jgi:hypothetical protein
LAGRGGGIPGIFKFNSVTPEKISTRRKINIKKLKMFVGKKTWREEGAGSPEY